MKKGFTLVEIMIVVAILGLLIAIGVPGFLTARNKSRLSTAKANFKALEDNIASYGVNETEEVDIVDRLWPASSAQSDPGSYVRKQLFCPISKAAYSINTATYKGSCADHGYQEDLSALYE